MEWKKNIIFSGNKLLNLLFYFCLVCLFLFALQLFCFTSFKIPSDSMEPVLVAGDWIMVNKMVKGARLFNLWRALNSEEVKIYRIPGLGEFKRNDVLVFNFPYREGRWDSICFDVMKYYVKRCVALPGDTLEIRKGFYKIRGIEDSIGNLPAQQYISGLGGNNCLGIVMESFPQNKVLDWTIQEFGPLVIPHKEMITEMNEKNYLLYKQLIDWEQKKKLRIDGNRILLSDSVIKEYQFLENYYFVSGDKMIYSQDSRYWGMLPESYIVGKAELIWRSEDLNTGKIRWERMMKRIKSN